MGSRDRLAGFEISDPEDVDKPTGTVAKIVTNQPGPKSLLEDRFIDNLTAIFALYLKMYPELSINFGNSELEPTSLQQHSADYTLDTDNTKYGEATLTMIEWSTKVKVKRDLFLCDANGVTLADHKSSIRASGCEFTAYIRWDGFRYMEDRLMLAENDQEIAPIINAARNKMREHFNQRSKQHILTVVQEWKDDQVYPYSYEPTDEQEEAVRNLFDVVAVKAAPAVNSSNDKIAKRLSLRLLREALETNPTALHQVLTEVLQLSSDSLDELSRLLDHTTLSAIIKASSMVVKRLQFLRGLEILVFDPESKQQLRERSQLHRILANETWVFGEEYALTVDDQSLTNALKAHIKVLGRDELVQEPVLDDEGKNRILDLLLARTSPQARDRHEHLVVELKAPNKKIGAEEITQIERYAFAVAGDERFNMTDVEWDFIIVSSGLDDYASIRQKGQSYLSIDLALRIDRMMEE